MSVPSQRAAGVVVVGVDGSDASLAAAGWAAREARRRHGRLVLVYATNVVALYAGYAAFAPQTTVDVREAAECEGAELLAQARKTAQQAADVNIETRVEHEAPAVALRHTSREAWLLVLGNAGRGRVGTALGSVTLSVAAHAECPVVVTDASHAAETSPDRPVVVGVDGGPLSRVALSYAFQAATLRNVPVTAAHVWADADAEREHVRTWFDTQPGASIQQAGEEVLAECLTGWAGRYPNVTVHRVVENAHPRQALAELSQQAQLLVVASRGRGGFAGLLLGSTSLGVLTHAACPVMLVGPESPTGT
jgi:nucleotide-binding universal stress UspA family protein